MNYYERVQKAIDYIEANLKIDDELEVYAKQAYMSISNFYRLFYAFAGLSIKEYIRLRRLSCAALELKQMKAKVTELALDYCFESPEAFTRAFKRQFGMAPMQYKKSEECVSLYERIDLMEKYFDCTDDELEKYPDIKVIKELPKMRVAYYRGKGYNAELDGFNTLTGHMRKKGILKDFSDHRIFGFDNGKLAEAHEYEVWITVDEKISLDDVIRVKEFGGGRYAVMNTKVKDIENSWKRFCNWLADSRYEMGTHQCLEEHLIKDESIDEDTSIDLYLPIAERRQQHEDEKKSAAERPEPEILEVEGFRVIGLKCITSEKDNSTNFTGKKLWDKFNKSSRKIRDVIDSAGAYGLIYNINDKENPENYGYMAGLKVSDDALIPDEQEDMTVEKGLYAKFTYRSSLKTRLDFENVGRLYQYIYQIWLPQSQYFYNYQNTNIEYYETARLQQPYPEYDIYISIKHK